eukprot:RCo016621
MTSGADGALHAFSDTELVAYNEDGSGLPVGPEVALPPLPCVEDPVVLHGTYVSDTEGPAEVSTGGAEEAPAVLHGTYVAGAEPFEPETSSQNPEETSVHVEDPFLPARDPLEAALHHRKLAALVGGLGSLALLAVTLALVGMYFSIPVPTTWTPTKTPTRTPSRTPTPTPTCTPSPTLSRTRTVSRTRSPDVTLTRSSTLTSTLSSTGTRTSTATLSTLASLTPTLTTTTTRSRTRTLTPIPTVTVTPSPTPTPTQIPTRTFSPTLTSSQTLTVIPTATPIPTHTLTPTSTTSRTRNATRVPTFSPTPTQSMTLTPVPTNTRTATFTRTSTETTPPTGTPTRTSTFTRTATATRTCPVGPQASAKRPPCFPSAGVSPELIVGMTCGLCSSHVFAHGDSCSLLRLRSDFVKVQMGITNDVVCNLECEASNPAVGQTLSSCQWCQVVALPATSAPCAAVASSFGVRDSDMFNIDDQGLLCTYSRQLPGDRLVVCSIPVPISRCQGLPEYVTQRGDTCTSVSTTLAVSMSFLTGMNPGLSCTVPSLALPVGMLLCVPCGYSGLSPAPSAVYLTFNAAPTVGTPEVLAVLAELAVRASFYIAGHTMDAGSDPNAAVNQQSLGAIVAGNHFIADYSYTGFSAVGQNEWTCSVGTLADCITDYNNNWSIVGQVLSSLGIPTNTLLPAFQKNKRVPCFNDWRSASPAVSYDCSSCGDLHSRTVVPGLANYLFSLGIRVLGWTWVWCPPQLGLAVDSAGSPTCVALSAASPKQNVCDLVKGLEETGSPAPSYGGVAQRVLWMYSDGFGNSSYEGSQNIVQLRHLIRLLKLRGHTFRTVEQMGVPT